MSICTLSQALSQRWDVVFWGLLHKRRDIAIPVTEECHPWIMILDGRDQVGLAGESHAALLKFVDSEGDIRTAAVDWRTGRSCPRLLCLFQQQPDSVVIQERHVAKAI
jgi:hypothetical protein